MARLANGVECVGILLAKAAWRPRSKKCFNPRRENGGSVELFAVVTECASCVSIIYMDSDRKRWIVYFYFSVFLFLKRSE